MTDFSLSIAGGVGIVLSAVFILWEVGHYATPQVSETRFEERREIFAYTVGLFVGILEVIPWIYFQVAFSNADLIGVFVFLLILVGLTELAQWAIRKTNYWGQGPSFPFYAVGLRCGIAGLLITGLVAQFLQSSAVTWGGAVAVGLQSIALLVLEATTALVSFPAPAGSGRTGGGPFASAIILFVGLFLLGFTAFAGTAIGAAAALIALAGAALLYRRARPILDRVRPPAPPSRAEGLPSRFGRTDRPGGPGGRV